MKIKFEVEYDSNDKQYTVVTKTRDINIIHSGSSYLRIIYKNEIQIGTIDCLKRYEHSNRNYLTFDVSNDFSDKIEK